MSDKVSTHQAAEDARNEDSLIWVNGAHTPVCEIAGRPIGTGRMGPRTGRLRALYKALIEGEVA